MSPINIVKLLIIDDKPENLKLISGFFEDTNYFVRSTTSPEEALDICNNTELDLILLDIRMPVDGFKVFNRIKSTANNCSTPVIFMAEKTDLENITKAYSVGARDVITKPFQLEELLSKVSTQSLLHVHYKQIQELVAAKNKIFSIIGHDLRSPFTALIGFANLLLENLKETDNIEAIKYTEIISRVSTMNLDLLDNLLTYAKDLEKDAQETLECININNTVSEVLQIVQPSALLKDIKLIQIFGEQKETYGTKDLIATMIRNIVSNAIKYTNDGGSVTIQTNVIGDLIEIEIADTGVGMDTRTINKLFDYNTKQSLEGTAGELGSGYGLLLSKEIADKHNGKISVDSTKGIGTNFKINLPIYSKN